MPLSDLTTCTITLDTLASTRPGFSIPLLVGVHTKFDTRTKSYSKPDDMLEDGFTTSDSLYIGAVDLCSQDRRPTSFLIGKRATPVAQVATIDVTDHDDGSYVVTINGTACTYVASTKTATEIRDGLIAAINAAVGTVVTAATVDTDTFTVTADMAGIPFTITVSAPSDNLTLTATTASVGILDDMAAIRAENDTWYGFAEDTRTPEVLTLAAQWAETVPKLFLAQDNDPNILVPGSTTDSAYILKGLAYVRTALVYHSTDAEWVDAAWLGRMLPEDPGSATWHAKKLASLTPDTLTAAQTAALVAKYANWFESIGGYSIAMNGKTAGNQYIDLVIARDWLVTNIELDMLDLLVSVRKIPYTDEGIAMVVSKLEARLREGARLGIVVADTIEIFTTEIEDIPAETRAARTVSGISFNCTVQGAIHKIPLTGTLVI